jgi:hypothetical protein
MADSLQTKRWGDFRRRTAYAPESVYRHRAAGWEYIPVHPFGDEPDLLARLGMRPEECFSADAWWGIAGDATLLETWIARSVNREAGLYARRTEHEEGWVYLRAILDVPFITRSVFEGVMSQFAALGFPFGERFQLRAEDGLIKLAEETCSF